MGIMEDMGRISSATVDLLKSPSAVLREVLFLLRSNPADYYAFLGDDVLEARDEGFSLQDKPLWLNLGYWETARTYPEACQAMARQLGNAAQLEAGNVVVDCGFGFGDQDFLWVQEYDVKLIRGLNITPLHVETAEKRGEQLGLADRLEFQVGSATQMPFDDNSVDRVLALESAFHFDTRQDFFNEAFRVLKPGGRLGTADMLPNVGEKPTGLANWLGQRRWGLPRPNLYDRNTYLERMADVGFVDTSCRSIRHEVFPGMGKYAQLRHDGVPMSEAVIELSQQEMDSCVGVEAWAENGGLTDYVLFGAQKPA